VRTNAVTWSDEMFRIYGLERDNCRLIPRVFPLAPPSGRSGERVQREVARAVERGSSFAYHLEPRAPTQEDRALLARATHLAGIAIEQRQLEQQLRDLSAHVESVREDERTGIAREIHDELGQALTALKMDFAWLARRISGGGSAPDAKLIDMIASMSQMIGEVIQQVRRISSELRPSVLDDREDGEHASRAHPEEDEHADERGADALRPSQSTRRVGVVGRNPTPVPRLASPVEPRPCSTRRPSSSAWRRSSGPTRGGTRSDSTTRHVLRRKERSTDGQRVHRNISNTPCKKTLLHCFIPSDSCA